MSDDILDRLADCRPTHSDEWTAERRASVRARLFDDLSTTGRIRFRSRHRFPATAVAAAAIVVLIAGILVAVARGVGRGGGNTGPAGVPWNPPAGLSDRAEVSGNQWAYTVTADTVSNRAGARPSPGVSAVVSEIAPVPVSSSSGRDANTTTRDYTSADGDLVSIRTGDVFNGCFRYSRRGGPSLDYPTAAFLATLPTDVDELARYLGGHVNGSSSQDEAVFVVVGDVLRQANALASPKLRAAMLAVLSRLPEVTVHTGDTDSVGRAAIRADFVDQAIRPGEVNAYYFDATDFRLVEQRDASNGEPTTYDGPSPAYSSPRADGGVDPAHLDDTNSVSVIRLHSVVDELPQEVQNCPQG